MIAVKNFCFDDLLEVTRFVQQSGLGTSEIYLRDHLLLNPSLACDPSFTPGVAVFDGARCVAFQGLVFRRLYVGQTSVWGCEGSVLAMDKEYSAYVVGTFFKEIMLPRGQLIYYSNTSMPKTVRLLKVAGMKNPGPESCAHIRFYVFRWGSLLNGLCRQRGFVLPRLCLPIIDMFGRFANLFFCRRSLSGTVSENVTCIDEARFDAFWNDYVLGNDGVVVSRTAEDLQWLFGKGLADGRFIMITRKSQGRLKGYIVLKKQVSELGLRWMVSDWIALGNDSKVLHDLLLDARRAVASTAAFCLELTGFPTRIQPVVNACLPFSRKAICNTFSFKLFNGLLKESLQNGSDRGWFWGPMDGDRCVN